MHQNGCFASIVMRVVSVKVIGKTPKVTNSSSTMRVDALIDQGRNKRLTHSLLGLNKRINVIFIILKLIRDHCHAEVDFAKSTKENLEFLYHVSCGRQ